MARLWISSNSWCFSIWGLKKTNLVQQELKHPPIIIWWVWTLYVLPFHLQQMYTNVSSTFMCWTRKGTPLAAVCESSTMDLLGLSYRIGQETHSASASAGRVWQAESRWSHWTTNFFGIILAADANVGVVVHEHMLSPVTVRYLAKGKPFILLRFRKACPTFWMT